MNTSVRLKVEMAIRVRNLLRNNPFGEPKADAVVARFEERVARAQGLMTQQQSGVVMARSARTRRTQLRRRVRDEPLRHLSEIAKVASIESPSVADLFRWPAGNLGEQEFRAVAQTFMAQAGQHQELLREHGMREGLIAELTALLAEYDQAVSEVDAARGSHIGARTELDELSRDLVKVVHQLNGMILYKIRDNTELRGAWESARNIALPIRGDGTIPEPADPNLPPAPPSRSAA